MVLKGLGYVDEVSKKEKMKAEQPKRQKQNTHKADSLIQSRKYKKLYNK